MIGWAGWVVAHWKPLAAALALVASFAAGWVVRGPRSQPSVALKQDTNLVQAAAERVQIKEVAGPVKIVTQTVTKYRDCTITPGVRQGSTWTPSPAETITTTTETRGAVTTDTKASEQSSETLAQHTDLKITPAAARSFLLGAKLNPTVQLAIGGAVRLPELPLVGLWWVQGQVAPDLAHPLQSDVHVFLRKDF